MADGVPDTETAILDAALAEVLAHGIRRTTASDIARRCGIARQTLYRYWPDAQSVFAALVTLIGMATFTWMFAEKVINTRADNVGTFDLRQPVWIYYMIAWIGLAAAVVLLVLRTVRLLFSPEKLANLEHKPIE